MAEILRVDAVNPEPTLIARAADCLRSGGLVAFPTETVYGLGADATNPVAVRRVFAAKGRPATDPLIVHVADLDAARPFLAGVPSLVETLASHFWPGPLTLVLPRSDLIGDEVTAGLSSVAIRVPAHPVALALVRAAGVPVAAPSANPFSRPSPTRADHVISELGGQIDIVLDAGPTPVGIESTVLDPAADPPAILRPGGVSLERLRQVLPTVVVLTVKSGGGEALSAPGQLTRHYAPRTPLTVFDGPADVVVERIAAEARSVIADGRRVVVLASSEMLARLPAIADASHRLSLVDFGSEHDPDALAATFYAKLRECDMWQADRILASQLTEETGITLAVRDRLMRASSGDIVRCGSVTA